MFSHRSGIEEQGREAGTAYGLFGGSVKEGLPLHKDFQHPEKYMSTVHKAFSLGYSVLRVQMGFPEK